MQFDPGLQTGDILTFKALREKFECGNTGGTLPMEQEFTEKDWKLFRSRISGWQEAYIDRLNKEYIELLSSEDAPSKKFWKLKERIRKDKNKAGVTVEMRRSEMIYNIRILINQGVITMEDLTEFSAELKKSVRSLP